LKASVAETKGGVGPHVALFAVQLIFGTWPIAGKIALRELPSTGLVALRVGGAAVAFVVLRRLTGPVDLPGRKDLARFALYSLLGVVLNQFLFTKGLAHSTAVNATLLSTAIPVFTLLVGALLGYERLSARVAFGTLVAAAGVFYLVDPFQSDFGGSKTFGNVLLVANTFCYGAYIAVSKEAFIRHGALTAMTWVFAFGAVLAVPVGGYTFAQSGPPAAGWETWAAVAYIVLVPTVGAYYLNAWALERVSASTVAVYIYLQPLIAFAVAPLVLGAEEQWGPRTYVAAALIFAGVAFVTLRRREGLSAVETSEHPDAPGR
jgi:drug/metabolite transporter (DMT)-like permease